MWSVVDDAERAQWSFVPFETVGPLRFGMSIEEVATAMGAQGFTSTHSSMTRPHGALVEQAGFRAMDAPLYEEAVTAYYRTSGDLAAVAVDALCGPQVCVDGLRLIGRVPSELAKELHGYAEDRGMLPTISVEGDAVSEELGLLVRAQRAGDILLSRAFFVADFQDWAYTVHDCVPADEWDVR
ncbi:MULTISPECIES: hypothetical protein [unclassified Streptomyces]|uniref:hypothetical protein n=1 Tax=unclassified Streptomyces TaxID=2593676 RepID=UPI00068ACB35|nr:MULTISPECIES: hypothetical protein [unclassified Streptomyces]